MHNNHCFATTLTRGWKALPFLNTLSGSFSLLRTQLAWGQVWGILHNEQQQQLVVLHPDKQSFRIVEKNNTFAPTKIHDLVLDKKERLWIATSQGLYMLVNSHLSLLSPFPALNPQRLRNTRTPRIRQNSRLWIGYRWCRTAFGVAQRTKYGS